MSYLLRGDITQALNSPMYGVYIRYVTMKGQKKFTITKRIAKHGTQAIIVIPRILEHELKPGTLTEIQISILTEAENDTNS